MHNMILFTVLLDAHSIPVYLVTVYILTKVKPVYNDHLMGYFSAIWSSSRWPKAT